MLWGATGITAARKFVDEIDPRLCISTNPCVWPVNVLLTSKVMKNEHKIFILALLTSLNLDLCVLT